MTTETAALYFVDTFRNPRSGEPKYRLLEKVQLRFYATAHFQKGHPIFETFEFWLFRIHAAGFALKINSELRRGYAKSEVKIVDIVIPLDVRDIEIALYILLFGYTAAVICFLLEYMRII